MEGKDVVREEAVEFGGIRRCEVTEDPACSQSHSFTGELAEVCGESENERSKGVSKCYTETPVRVAEGKGAGCSDRLNLKTPMETLLDNPYMCRRRES